MITVGEFLKEERVKKKLTLEQAERTTKIRAKFLDALEKNQFEKLPDPAFTKGFIRNYAIFLGLSPSDAMAFYRRQVDEGKHKHLPSRGLSPLIRRFKLTPQIFTGVLVSIFMALFFGYLVYSYFRFAGAPSLMVDAPKNNQVVKENRIKVSGKADPDATLTINGQTVQILEDGSFSIVVPLVPGLNELTISAKNKYQKESVVTKNIRLEN